MPETSFRLLLVGLFALVLGATSLQAQDTETTYSIEVEADKTSLDIGDTGQLSARVLDASGAVQDLRLMYVSRARRSLRIDRQTGAMEALKPGTHDVWVIAFHEGGGRTIEELTVAVNYPPVTDVSFVNAPTQVYAGTRVPIDLAVIDAMDAMRDNVDLVFTSSNPSVATMDEHRHLLAQAPGTLTLTVQAEDVTTETMIEVVPNPVVRLELGSNAETARTGDVLQFAATAYDAQGNVVGNAPIHYSFQAELDDPNGVASSGQMDADGSFVADDPGLYTVIATSGTMADYHIVRITEREVTQEIELIGHALVSNVHTSDLWVWEGQDGRDYAITGTWGGNGEAYFWDVTDPANPIPTDTMTVDARTVNDVKVSEDGSVCIMTREGASDRKNGFVLLDCSDPYNVTELAKYDDGMTGGVHNVFIADNHVYAVNNGQRYDIINIEDPANPVRVGRFELDTPGHAIHDVWVVDGIAYSSNWSDGVYMVDVGNGVKGGSVANPVVIGHYAYPSGWNHAAFPYKDPETGKFYVIAGDEAFPYGLNTEDRPTRAAGWIHFIDFTDPENPQEVARYEVPEAGTHNFWVEDEKLYIGYYNGGLRVVDISGDLKGDLYNQGREIARFFPEVPDGRIANAPMVWGPQPHKGHVFFSDWNSGLWVVKLQGDEQQEKPGT